MDINLLRSRRYNFVPKTHSVLHVLTCYRKIIIYQNGGSVQKIMLAFYLFYLINYFVSLLIKLIINNYHLYNRLNVARPIGNDWQTNVSETSRFSVLPDGSPWAFIVIDNILLASQAASKWLLASRYSFFPYDRQLARIVIVSSFARSHYVPILFPLSIGTAPLTFSLILSTPSPLHPRSIINFSFSRENEWRGLPVIGSSAAHLVVFYLLRIQWS